AMALLDIALKPADEAQKLASGSITELRAVVEARRGELGKQVTEALLTFIHHAEADTRSALSNLEKLQANVEHWFDAGMDRVSSIYRRRAQLSSTILALFFVAALNLDSSRITRALANDPVLRATLIAQATVVVKADAAAAAQPAPPPIEEAPKSAPSATADALRQLQTDVSTINQLGIPIGWDDNPPRDNLWWWLNKVLGL